MGHGHSNPQWDAREQLEGTRSHRRIGVVVGRAFHHHGMGAIYVDIERETPTVNTAAWGNCYPVEETRARTREAFAATISDLDRLIWHLAGHRDRLKADLETLDGREFQEGITAPATADAPKARTPAVVDVHLPETA